MLWNALQKQVCTPGAWKRLEKNTEWAEILSNACANCIAKLVLAVLPKVAESGELMEINSHFLQYFFASSQPFSSHAGFFLYVFRHPWKHSLILLFQSPAAGWVLVHSPGFSLVLFPSPVPLLINSLLF